MQFRSAHGRTTQYAMVLLSASCLLTTPPEARAQSVSRTANETVVRRCADELWNKHKRAFIPMCYTTAYVSHTNGVTAPHKGLDAESEALAVTLNTWPDIKLTYEAVIVSGDFVTARWVMTAHHSLTAKEVDSHGITIFRLVNGKIAEDWTTFDRVPLIMAMEQVPGAS